MHYYLNNNTGDVTALDCGLELAGAARYDALVHLVRAIYNTDDRAVSDAIEHRAAAGGDVQRDGPFDVLLAAIAGRNADQYITVNDLHHIVSAARDAQHVASDRQ